MMSLDSPMQALHSALAHAVYGGVFPDVTYEDRDWEHYRKTKEDRRVMKTRKVDPRDVIIEAMFPQTWGSTSLGFSGIGGQAITSAYTVVIECSETYAVYFGGQFAYSISFPNGMFFQDLRDRMLAKQSESGKYNTKRPA